MSGATCDAFENNVRPSIQTTVRIAMAASHLIVNGEGRRRGICGNEVQLL